MRLLVILLLFNVSDLLAKDVKVGYYDCPPFVYEQESNLQGLHFDLWEKVSDSQGFETTYLRFLSLEELKKAVTSDSVQVAINPFLLNENLLKKHHVSTPTYINTIGVATKYDFKHRSWFRSILQIVSLDFIKVAVFVGVIIFLFGFLMWIAEKKKNSDHFDDSRKGLVDSFWWSAVTMTTVGYGDKYPKTFSGRMIALIWMFTAMIIISSLTAGITMILTVSNLSSGITQGSDLDRLNVGTVKESTSDLYLSTIVEAETYPNFTAAMVDLAADELDVIVFDKAKMVSHIRSNKLHQDFEVLSIELEKELVGFVYSKEFPDRKQIDVQLALIKSTPKYKWFLMQEGLD